MSNGRALHLASGTAGRPAGGRAARLAVPGPHDRVAFNNLALATQTVGEVHFTRFQQSDYDKEMEQQDPTVCRTNVYATFENAPDGYTVHIHVSQALDVDLPDDPGAIECINLKYQAGTVPHGGHLERRTMSDPQIQDNIRQSLLLDPDYIAYFQRRKTAYDQMVHTQAVIERLQTNTGDQVSVKQTATGPVLQLGGRRMDPNGVGGQYTAAEYTAMLAELSAAHAVNRYYREYDAYSQFSAAVPGYVHQGNKYDDANVWDDVNAMQLHSEQDVDIALVYMLMMLCIAMFICVGCIGFVVGVVYRQFFSSGTAMKSKEQEKYDQVRMEERV